MHLNDLSTQLAAAQPETLAIKEYLDSWASDSGINANAAGRLVRAIGPAQVIETAKDPRLGRIFSNRTIKTYSCFDGLYGIEEPLEQIVDFLRHSSRGLQQNRQILNLVGPVGTGKSTIVEILRTLMETQPVWVLGYREKGADEPTLSPVFENPLGLFNRRVHGGRIEEQFKIPLERLNAPMSRWAALRVDREKGDLKNFCAVRVNPSMVMRVCMARVEPNELKKIGAGGFIGHCPSGKPDEYVYSGGLNATTQGMLEIFEMGKANPSALDALLGATQDYKYAGAGGIGELPYQGLIVAHSNSTAWESYRDAKDNEGMKDRVVPIIIPYCVRVQEEAQAYARYIAESDLRDLPCAPGAFEVAAHFAVRTRLDSSNREQKIRIYNGLPPHNDDESGPSADELRSDSLWKDGLDGLPTREMQKLLAIIADADSEESGFDPVAMFEMLECSAARGQFPEYNGLEVSEILDDEVTDECRRIVQHVIERACFEDFDGLKTIRFARYVSLLDKWVEGEEYKDEDTGAILTLAEVDRELARFEKGVRAPKSGANTQQFRRDVNRTVLRFQGETSSAGKPAWEALDPNLWLQYEQNLMPTRDEIIEIIRTEKRDNDKQQKKHEAFFARLCASGFTKRQAFRTIEWYLMHIK